MAVGRLATCLALVVLVAGGARAHAQTTDDLFAADALHDLQLFVNSRDLRLLRETFDENTYYQADLVWRGIRVRSVAIRSRGSGSRNPTKPGLKIDFDRFAAGQRFLGLESVVLDNLWQDPSLVRESVTMALFAKLGQPAPREVYTRLFINGTYQGLYTIVEAIDTTFAARVFGDADGYVFQYRWLNEYHGEYLGRSLDPYKARFRPENHELDADTSLYSPLHDLFRAVDAPESAAWRESVERYLDVPTFLTHVAIETFVSELDGILGSWGMNNFSVYRPAGSTEHRVIPWDRDNAFQASDSAVMLRASDNVLIRRLLEHPDLREYYLRALEACAHAAEDGWLEQEIEATANRIRAAAYEDVYKPATNEAFESELAFLRSFAQTRPGFVLAEIERIRGER